MTMLSQIRGHQIRAWKTLAMYSVFLMYGLTSGLLGPTMLDLQLRVNGTIAQLSYILPGRSIGIVAGSLIIGIIYQRVNFQLLVIICMSVTLICNILIPLNTGFIGLICTFCLNGFVGGLTGSGANTFLIQLWGRENPPFLQALHFSYGLGALIAPLIGRPFLLPLDPQEFSVRSNGGDGNASLAFNVTDAAFDVMQDYDQQPLHQYTPDDVKLIYPYGIVGLLHLIPIVYFVFLWHRYPQTPEHPSRLTVPTVSSSASAFPPPLMHSNSLTSEKDRPLQVIPGHRLSSPPVGNDGPSCCWKWLLIVLILLFMPCAYGIEMTYGSYLTTFAVTSDLHLSKSTGAYMTSLYWTFFTFFRLATVFYIDIIGPEANIAINTGFLLLANVIIFPFANSSPVCLWIGSFLMGIGNSSIFASVFGFIENYFPVSSNLASAMMVSSFCGEFVFPVIISKFMEDTPSVFLDVTAVCSLAMLFLFAATVLVARLKLQRQSPSTAAVTALPPPPPYSVTDTSKQSETDSGIFRS